MLHNVADAWPRLQDALGPGGPPSRQHKDFPVIAWRTIWYERHLLDVGALGKRPTLHTI
jgi:hypothetical protein